MKDQILSNLDRPEQLEKLYRADKPAFKRAYKELHPQFSNPSFTGFWDARLAFVKDEVSWGSRNELVFVIVTALVAGLIAKLPAFTGWNEEVFYTRNAGFIVFTALTAFFAWKNNLPARNIALIAALTLAALVFINLLPDNRTSDTLMLSCMHLVLFLWAILGFAFVGQAPANTGRRLEYLKYNGDLVVMTTLIVIAAAILSGVTIGLFSLIGLKIEEFYFQNVVVFGLPAAPILASYLTRTNPQLVGRVSPVIARLFSPLVLVMLVVYLAAIIYSGKDPYNDREFLMMFNALLIGVMAIIFFSVAEATRSTKTQAEHWVLFLLSILTIVVNGIALSAILFRISEWGITPNRAAVLGSNVLVLVNLFLVAGQLFRVIRKKADISGVGNAIAFYLPVYALWAAIVTFTFPFLFGFR